MLFRIFAYKQLPVIKQANTGKLFYFSVVKSFDVNTAISGNFVLTVENFIVTANWIMYGKLMTLIAGLC